MKDSVIFRRIAIALLIPLGIAGCTPESETISTTPENPTETTEPAPATTTEPAPATTAEPAPATTAEPPVATAEPTAEPSTPVTNTALAAKNYCYEREAGDVHTYARIKIDADNRVSGGIQHDFPPAGDVSSILVGIIFGTANGDTLDISKSTFSEYDTVWFFPPGQPPETESVTWKATPQMLSVDEGTAERIFTDQLESSDCERVNSAMKRRAGQNSTPLIAGYSNVTRNDVQFDAGEFGTTVSGGLVGGEAAMYLLPAQAGQTMTLEAKAGRDNAVFHVVSPSGVLLVREQLSATIELPESGTYEILVSGVRGNVSYDLDIEVQ